MNNNSKTKALVLIDFINEIIDPAGKLAGKGYARFEADHHTLSNVSAALHAARATNTLIVYVRLGFSPTYVEQPGSSPLFGGAKKFEALRLGGWGTEIHASISPLSEEVVLTKHRISAFYSTQLDLILRNQGVSSLLIAGVATDLAVQSAARDAHDRDYDVTVLADCCVAANEEDHATSLKTLAKISTVTNFESAL